MRNVLLLVIRIYLWLRLWSTGDFYSTIIQHYVLKSYNVNKYEFQIVLKYTLANFLNFYRHMPVITTCSDDDVDVE